MVQVSYFLLQICVRKANSLPIAQLELGVSAYVGFTAITYLARMQRPRSVNTAIVLLASSGPAPPQVTDRTTNKKDGHTDRHWLLDETELVPLKNHAVLPCFALAGSGFGAIHFAAWNSDFCSAPLDLRTLAGGHYHLHDHPRAALRRYPGPKVHWDKIQPPAL
jgi:hypothetical protein